MNEICIELGKATPECELNYPLPTLKKVKSCVKAELHEQKHHHTDHAAAERNTNAQTLWRNLLET